MARLMKSDSALRRGALAMVPLWAGVAPFGLAFGVLARAGGFTILETQALSLFLFAGAAEVAVVTLTASGAGALTIFLAIVLLNLRHLLYGLSLSQYFPARTRPPKALLAFVLTDEAYGLTIKSYLDGVGSPLFLAGAGGSLYLVFNLATLAGALLGNAIANPHQIGLDFVFPLTFLALLVPLLRSRGDVAVAALSAGLMLALVHFVSSGPAILLASVPAAAFGAALPARRRA